MAIEVKSPLNPKDKIAVCILANAPGELADNGIPLFFDLFNTPSRYDQCLGRKK